MYANDSQMTSLEADYTVVPDLVFNEMKFLQRPTEHQNEPAETEEVRLVGKKNDKKRPNDEEISAYFITTKDAIAGQAATTSKRQKRLEPNEVSKNSHRLSNMRQTTAPVDLPEKPFLGFGSKGAQPANERNHDDSTAYFSWSKSSPAHPPPAPPKEQAIHNVSPRRARHAAQSSTRIDARDVEGEHGNHKARKNRKWVSTKRAKGSSLVEVYQLLNAERPRGLLNETSVTKTTTQSLPHYPSLERETVKEGPTSNGLRSSYRTSEILDIRSEYGRPEYQTRNHHLQRKGHNSSEKENMDPTSSIDRLLSQARRTVTESRPGLRSKGRSTRPQDEELVEIRNGQRSRFTEDRRARSNGVPLIQEDSREQARRSNWESQQAERAQSGHYRPTSTAHFISRTDARATYPQDRYGQLQGTRGYHGMQQEDDEMLDNNPSIERIQFAGNLVYATSKQAEGLVYQENPAPGSGNFEAQASRSEMASHPMSLTKENLSAYPSSVFGLSVGPEFRSGQVFGLQSEKDDEFAGFWKPHKLY